MSEAAKTRIAGDALLGVPGSVTRIPFRTTEVFVREDHKTLVTVSVLV
jgi:hypothetical protein